MIKRQIFNDVAGGRMGDRGRRREDRVSMLNLVGRWMANIYHMLFLNNKKSGSNRAGGTNNKNRARASLSHHPLEQWTRIRNETLPMNTHTVQWKTHFHFSHKKLPGPQDKMEKIKPRETLLT